MHRSRLNLVLSIAALFLAGLFLSALAGCCPPCIRPTLPTEPPPVLLEVVSDDNAGLDEENTKAILGNLYIYQGALDRCNDIIIRYNGTVQP